ncbi:protein transport protein Sec16A-like isoform X2 [Otolemur garnettii]|uniref:protein transport protein Sec16A-like isoform X2 n=1 Tax=Otolemur garnettii TaxID=30611 RepID=UPI000C7F274D|nr:protein transport protein Sec16A-like isoform X2 [Otolemur garnettii]
MQPPPQAVPSGVAAPPPAGNPQSIFWTNSPYRRRANNNAPVAPITCPLQPVTDPFAFSRQALQNTPLGSLSKSSPPILQGPAPPGFPQHSGLPAPHTNARDSSQGPCEPLLRPPSQPRADTSSFSDTLTSSALPRAEMNRSAEIHPSAETEVPAPPYLQHYIPGVGPDLSHGAHLHGSMPGPDQHLRRQNPNDDVVAPAATPFSPQPRQQIPGHWGPVQASPQPSGQNQSLCLEGPVQITVPHATSVPHLPSSSSPHQGLGQEPHNPVVSLSAPLASDGRSEVAYPQSESYSANNFDPENTFRQNPRVGNTWTSQEFGQNPGVNEHQPIPTFVSPLAQGDNPENHMHHPPGAGASLLLPDTDSGALSMFFQGAETENEENLSSENTGSAAKSEFEGFSSNSGLGHAPLPTHGGGGGICQDFLQGSNIETTQHGGETHFYFAHSASIQHDEQTTKNTASDMRGDTANAGTQGASASQYENIENLEFIQNQEVLPSESLNFNASSPSDQFRYGVLPGPSLPRHSAVGHTGAPDTALHPVRSDSMSSGYSSKSHRSLSGSTRPQELVGTFIQQEVGKPEDEVSGSFFKQIDSSPMGGETDETSMSQNYHSSLSQPSTPSPPKPTGIFQTSANSSFEPVKSHLVGVKPVKADRANVVGEVRGTRAYQKKRRPPDASPGNLEQPPDNMETLYAPQVCPLPLSITAEVGRVLPHTGGPPLDTVHPTPERKPSARAHGAGKCESPATTLWAQNELPDFGGNVLLAPAAPVLQVPTKPQPPAIVQPPEEVVPGQQSQKPDSAIPLQNRDGIGALENLENPPTVGEEEALKSQVTKDAQDQPGLGSGLQGLVPPQQQSSSLRVPKTTLAEPSSPESPPAQGQPQNSAHPPASLAPADAGQQLPPQLPQSSSASLMSTGSSQVAKQSEPQWPQPMPPQALGPLPQDMASYYHYRPLHEAYQSQYPSLYPPDPGVASLYYQDVYGLYEPRYRPYDSATSVYAEYFRCPEPERPSSRASHCSDRPPPRQGYPEGYYNSKNGWSSQSDFYANYYSSQYDYRDPGRWDRFQYSTRFKDLRPCDQRYWYDVEYDPYRKEHYAYGDRLVIHLDRGAQWETRSAVTHLPSCLWSLSKSYSCLGVSGEQLPNVLVTV